MNGTLNPVFRDWFRLDSVKKRAKVKVFTWNLTVLDEASDLHFDGEISRSNIRRKEKTGNATVLQLKKYCLDYVVVDFVHLPTQYIDGIMPGALDVITWLTEKNIITANTIIEFKNLKSGHISSFGPYEKKLIDLKSLFSCVPLSFLDTVWGKETQKYYDYVLRKNFCTKKGSINIQDNFGDCVEGREILQFQLV